MSAVMTSRSMPSLGTKYSFVREEPPRALSLSRSLLAMVERRRFLEESWKKGGFYVQTQVMHSVGQLSAAG